MALRILDVAMLWSMIELKPNSKPVRLPPYRTGFLESKILKEQIERWIKAGICKPGISSFAAPVLLVRKATPGQYRCCLDLRSVNKLILQLWDISEYTRLCKKLNIHIIGRGWQAIVKHMLKVVKYA